MKKFLQNKDRFADLFNGCCFQGRQIIRAEDLREASENYVITDKGMPGKTLQKDLVNADGGVILNAGDTVSDDIIDFLRRIDRKFLIRLAECVV